MLHDVIGGCSRRAEDVEHSTTHKKRKASGLEWDYAYNEDSFKLWKCKYCNKMVARGATRIRERKKC